MQIAAFIGHPEKLDKETLYELRELVAKHPSYQAARLLFLQNLFLQHDPSFGEELRRSALMIPDRKVLFTMIEGDNYKIEANRSSVSHQEPLPDGNRTISLIDKFLIGIPQEETPRHNLTAVEATTDYGLYLLQMEDYDKKPVPDSPFDNRLDAFIEKKPTNISLPKIEEEEPLSSSRKEEDEDAAEEEYLTETLAKIYIKQGRYIKAVEIIRKLSAIYPKKNSYFADQIRFLEKLIINNKNKK